MLLTQFSRDSHLSRLMYRNKIILVMLFLPNGKSSTKQPASSKESNPFRNSKKSIHMIYDAEVQMLFFFQLYSEGSLFTKCDCLTTLPQLTVSESFYVLLFNFSTFLLFQVSDISSRPHWTTKAHCKC